ncbi:MAG: UDP-N-acetylmuramoyl-tripeptide--D-alanyl-D-alanine ligase [Planctomycetes bacterium]|nr:UDP-N-acetylmuramoyl-tripeptide--D-alanyl-D-alanine ligase [Planctomycetota bacterium]
MSRIEALSDRAAATPRTVRGTRSWLTAGKVANAIVGAEVLQRGRTAQGVVTDSRGDCGGKVFVALRGDRHDGHAHLLQAVENGAVGLVVDRPPTELAPLSRAARTRAAEPWIVRVPDTGEALLAIAAEHRRRHRAKVVGITGSCGKTSTKEGLGGVLQRAMPTVRSPASFNNHVGVPLSLLQIEADTRAAIVEIGTSSPGEIAKLTAVARPDVGIVTCVASAHLQGLGSLAGVAREKAALPHGLLADGLCILNGDDASCRAMAAECEARVEFTSVAREADWFATDLSFHALGTSFLLNGERRVTLPGLGTHNVHNALAVIAAAVHLGMPEADVLAALAAVPGAARRLEPKVSGGVTVFDDTYNMNPESARAALQALAGIGGTGKRVVVFGEMLELGDRSVELHRELGRQVAASGQDLLVAVGAGAEPIADGAIAGGMAVARVHRVPDLELARQLLLDAVRPGDLVLFKASRRVALVRLVDDLVRALAATERIAGAGETAGADD